MKIGDHVTINSYHSTFHKKSGVITEIVENSYLKYTVKFENTVLKLCLELSSKI